jgi:hypothetical protein
MSDRAASGNNSYELHEEEIRNIFIRYRMKLGTSFLKNIKRITFYFG